MVQGSQIPYLHAGCCPTVMLCLQGHHQGGNTGGTGTGQGTGTGYNQNTTGNTGYQQVSHNLMYLNVHLGPSNM